MKKFVLVQDSCGNFRMTTRENYDRMISDAREWWHFYKHEGFKTIEDVYEYIDERFGGVTRYDIEFIN